MFQAAVSSNRRKSLAFRGLNYHRRLTRQYRWQLHNGLELGVSVSQVADH